jgi:hypothetical protein
MQQKLEYLLEYEAILKMAYNYLGRISFVRNLEESRFTHFLGVIDSSDIQ